MHSLSDTDRSSLVSDMRSFSEPMPSIGTFRYDSDRHALTHIHKRELTPREINEAARRGQTLISFPDSIAEPVSPLSGRVVWHSDRFQVHLGPWAKSILDELTTLVEQEFALPYFEFVFD